MSTVKRLKTFLSRGTPRARREGCMVLITAVIAFAAIVQGWTTYLQWDISRRALDANERAWLIGEIESFFLADERQLPAFKVHTKNAGKSPAWGIRHVVACRFDPTRPPLPDPYPNELTIPPGDQRERTLKCWSTPTKDAAEMNEGREFWLWILTLYKDPFAAGKDRTSLECWHRQAGGKQTFEPCQVGANIYK